MHSQTIVLEAAYSTLETVEKELVVERENIAGLKKLGVDSKEATQGKTTSKKRIN